MEIFNKVQMNGWQRLTGFDIFVILGGLVSEENVFAGTYSQKHFPLNLFVIIFLLGYWLLH